MIWLCFLISLAATTAGAISGIGGGVIIRPLLDAVSPFSLPVIRFLSGVTVFCMALVSLARSRKNPAKIDYKKSSFLALGSVVGGILGKVLFDYGTTYLADLRILNVVQSALLILLTAGVFVFVCLKPRVKAHEVGNPALCALIGLGLGLISSFLGIGGGPINIAVLYYFFRMDEKTSAVNSIYVILFSQAASLVSTAASGAIPTFDPPVLGLMVAGGILGGLCGGIIAKKITNRAVNHLFLGMMLFIIAISTYNLIVTFV